MSLPAGLPTQLAADPGEPVVGSLVMARAWKYDGGAHWVVPGRYLGADEHGHWVLQPTGSLVSRPGSAFHAASDALCLFPRTGDWVGTFYDEHHPDGLRVYLDVSLRLGWRRLTPVGWEFNSIDMDLDVVGTADGSVLLDDEDEFAEHAQLMAYPPELMERLRSAATGLLARVRDGDEPFGSALETWFARGRCLPAQAVG